MKKIVFLFSLFTFITSQIYSISYQILAFRSYGDPSPRKMLLIGKVTGKGQSISTQRRRILDYDTRELVLTAKLHEEDGLRVGDKIFIIQKNPDHKSFKDGLVVAEAEVFSIFNTEFQGMMLKARGNIAMVSNEHFVARPDYSAERKLAFELYKKAEKYQHINELDKAIRYYQESLNMDSERPESYVRVSRIFRTLNRDHEAQHFFREAWKRIRLFNELKILLALPGEYLEHFGDYEKQTFIGKKPGKLGYYLEILSEIREFHIQLGYYQDKFNDQTFRYLQQKGIPELEYNYQMGRLYYNIYREIGSKNIQSVLTMLNQSQRKTLYKAFRLPGTKEKVQPKKKWSDAFLTSALYQFRLAQELNRLDPRPSYSLVKAAAFELERGLPKAKHKAYVDILEHYGRDFLNVPSEPGKMLQVRNLLNKYIQD
jgi:tetratricopeptide (TPR) repeat protein